MQTRTQPLTVDVFLSVDGWAGGATSPGYFGYPGPELEEWITPELALLNKIVFSGTLETASWPNTRVCRDDVVTEADRLKHESDVPLRTMGSLSVARQLCGAGLVDRLRLMTFPLLLGASGREPFFAGIASADLALIGHRALDGRVLLLEYRPTGRDIPQV